MRRVLVPLLALGLAACSAPATTLRTNMLHAESRPGASALPLETGQIVVSESDGAHALLFGLGPARYHPFTHAAVLALDPKTGDPFVYDMSAEFKPGLASTPPDSLRGGLRRMPFLDYVGMHLYVEVHDPPAGTDRARMAAKLDELWRGKVDFDPYWDYGDRSKLFCTELVSELLIAGQGAVPPLEPLSANPSLRRVLAWFGVRGDRSLPAGLFATGGAPKVVFSRWRSRAAAAAYFAAKGELHRRFTPDQKLGNLFVLDGHEVELQPSVESFLAAAVALYDGAPREVIPPEAEVRARVSALASARFGPF